jgi:hypothetical protein
MLAKEFFAACVSGDLTKVRDGLCAGLDPNAKYRGQTALMYACENGHPLVAKLLVQNGAKVNVLDTYGNTALHFACKNGHVSCAAVLMGSGAKTDIQSTLGGETPADIARSRGSIEMVRTVLYFDSLMKEETGNGSKPGSKENSPLRIRNNGEGETSLLVTGGGLDDGTGRAEAANPKEPVRRFDSPPRRAPSQASKERNSSKGATRNDAAAPAAGRENSSQTGEGSEESVVIVPAVSIGRRPPPPEADPEENRKSPPRKAANGAF